MTPTPEFARPQRLDQIGAGETTVAIAATAAECAALARRFDLASIKGLSADITLRREAAGIVAKGRVRASVEQHCVATGDPVAAEIDEPFLVRFVPEPAATADEVELSGDEVDTIFYSGGTIDLGEAAAETMALALDPFPRCPAAAEILRSAGVVDEDAVVPGERTGGLAGLKDLLGKA
ncbi:YceD family protein [Sphingomonas japonica]|uniref:Uncharacterized metal-binding protein YceD (DUF177 family) n=1 Tax=Sphingomonas japonica TaxID=511662 RepID=A0ABX0U2K3_9SPHN|nr:DUF177 domain-containing protein [Sphingomonas japonica]NIJ23931.1 uncharacterized metal-binding protein YceD (DUF177 family) [Sphingomonas japonica]